MSVNSFSQVAQRVNTTLRLSVQRSFRQAAQKGMYLRCVVTMNTVVPHRPQGKGFFM
jgi:hypothetical protein